MKRSDYVGKWGPDRIEQARTEFHTKYPSSPREGPVLEVGDMKRMKVLHEKVREVGEVDIWWTVGIKL